MKSRFFKVDAILKKHGSSNKRMIIGLISALQSTARDPFLEIDWTGVDVLMDLMVARKKGSSDPVSDLFCKGGPWMLTGLAVGAALKYTWFIDEEAAKRVKKCHTWLKI
jgi:hypothetical protein